MKFEHLAPTGRAKRDALEGGQMLSPKDLEEVLWHGSGRAHLCAPPSILHFQLRQHREGWRMELDAGLGERFPVPDQSWPTTRIWVGLTCQSSSISNTQPTEKLSMAQVCVAALPGHFNIKCFTRTRRWAVPSRCSPWHAKNSWWSWCVSFVAWTRQVFLWAGEVITLLCPLPQPQTPRTGWSVNAATRWRTGGTQPGCVRPVMCLSVLWWTGTAFWSGTNDLVASYCVTWVFCK